MCVCVGGGGGGGVGVRACLSEMEGRGEKTNVVNSCILTPRQLLIATSG